MPALVIKQNRFKSLNRHHPWVFSGSIEREDDGLVSGQTVDLLTRDGLFLAKAAYSPHSQIRARVWTFDEEKNVNAEFLRKRIENAIALRESMGFFDHTASLNNLSACRLIHGESDDIPGLIVDQYANNLIVQFLSAGAEFWKKELVDLLVESTGIQNVYNRSDAEVRNLEGLPIDNGLIQGNSTEKITIIENDLKFSVDIIGGHKTGFYLDQSKNRKRVKKLVNNRDVLDCFSYTGGFSINALAGGAKSVVSIDASDDAISTLKENIQYNNLPHSNIELIQGDVFQLLRKFRDSRRSFDLIILDPPKFAQTASQVEKASRGYKDINLLAFKLLRPGGILVTFSCSGGVSGELFQKIVAGAALDANVNAKIVEHLHQSGDHPVSLNFPEGYYLKGLICTRE